jgi:lysophospholipase L1-like esterase
MNTTLKFLVIGILVLVFSSCDNDTEESTPTPTLPSNLINKIMPLGGSRVEGNRPDFESFRYELWKDLTENGWTFDYIGTQSDNTTYPAFNNSNFDTDHEGRGGWTSGQILDGLDGWVSQAGTPDIVLFSSPAGNDGLQNLPYNEAVANINSIIDILQATNPNVTIIIEQMAPPRSDSMTGELATYLNQLQQDVLTIASEQSTASSQVIAIDMYTGFTDALLADDVHYNEAGADFIAQRYYNVLAGVLAE